MNSLNSVLLEGELVADPVEVDEVCHFTISIVRCIKDAESEVSNILIQTSSPVLTKNCMKYLDKGRGVRVVGRLSASTGVVKVVAEHAEFKP